MNMWDQQRESHWISFQTTPVYFTTRIWPVVEFNNNSTEMREFIYLEGRRKWRKIKQLPPFGQHCLVQPSSPYALSWRHSHIGQAGMLYSSYLSSYQSSWYLPYCKQTSLALSLSLRNRGPHFLLQFSGPSVRALLCKEVNRQKLYLKRNGR